MPEPTTAELVEQVRAGIGHRGGDQAHASLDTLSERLEAAEQERDSWKETAEVLDDESAMASLLASEKEEREAAEARVQELERALRIVRDWIREGIGTEAEAAEAMDAALEPPEPTA